jgi:hypothetical protein
VKRGRIGGGGGQPSGELGDDLFDPGDVPPPAWTGDLPAVACRGGSNPVVFSTIAERGLWSVLFSGRLPYVYRGYSGTYVHAYT